MWRYSKIKDGYARYTAKGSQEMFMFRILTDDKHRSLLRKIIQYTWCKIVGHSQSGICIEKGYTNYHGEFRIEICKNCYAGVMFYERKKNYESG